MSELTKSGREPIEIVTIHQDFCNLTFGEAPCYAGRMNFYFNSSDLTDDVHWTRPSQVGVYGGQPDPFGGNTGFRLYNLSGNNTASVQVRVYDTHFQNPTAGDGTTWITGYGKVDPMYPDVKIIFLQVILGSPFSIFQLEVDMGDGTIYSVANPEVAEDYYFDYDESTGWVRLHVGIKTDRFVNSGVQIAYGFKKDGTFIGPGEGAVFVAPQISTRQNDDYFPTVGQPVSNFETTPCFNTRVTCHVPDVYDRGTLEVKLCSNRSRLPRDGYYLPVLETASVTPGEINAGGGSSNSSALGRRSTLSVVLSDMPHNDRGFDKYRNQRNYDPLERSTLWAKWRARNPYYMHRRIDHTSGYLDAEGNVVESITRTFFMTGFDGPSTTGRVTINAKDVLTLAENEKAQYPKPTSGQLSADLSTGATSFTLSPAGVGEQYNSGFGRIRINDEIMSYTSRSGDVISGITRGVYGTEISEHDEGDNVQQCRTFAPTPPQDILYTLLTEGAGIDPMYLDKAQWDAEQLAFLPRLYSTLLSEPVGVSELIGEMCQQMYFIVWWDDREAKVKIRAVRPASGEVVTSLDDNRHLLMDSVKWKDLSDELLTQVWVYYGLSTPVSDLEKATSYRNLAVIANQDAEGPDRNNMSRVKRIYSRWITSENAAAAEDLGEQLLRRYALVPRECQFDLDAKDREVWLGSFVQLTNRLAVDFYGVPETVNLQVTQAQEKRIGTTYSYKAQEFLAPISEPVDPDYREIPITSDFGNLNLRQYHDSIYAPPTGTETIVFVIRSGVKIGGYAVGGTNVQPDPSTGGFTSPNDFYDGGNSSLTAKYHNGFVQAFGDVPILQREGLSSVRMTNAGDPYPGTSFMVDINTREYPTSVAIRTGDWPNGVTLRLVVESGAEVYGEGGNGSIHAYDDTQQAAGPSYLIRGVRGGDGGHALAATYPITIDNRGAIRGGSGGGGVARLITSSDSSVGVNIAVGGGGGAGYAISDIKELTGYVSGAAGAWVERQPAIGDFTGGGAGGQWYYTFTTPNTGGYGGNGGANASQGQTALVQTAFATRDGSVGGLAGYLVTSGANLITWENRGNTVGQERN